MVLEFGGHIPYLQPVIVISRGLQLPRSLLDQPLQLLVARRRAGADLFAVDEQGIPDAPLEEGGSLVAQVLRPKRGRVPHLRLDYSIL